MGKPHKGEEGAPWGLGAEVRGEDLDPTWDKGQRGHEASTPPHLGPWPGIPRWRGQEWALDWARLGARRRLDKGLAMGQKGAHR